MDERLFAVFGFENKSYELAGGNYWPAVIMPDGRLVRFLEWLDSSPLIVVSLEEISLGDLWEKILKSKGFVAKPRRSLPSHWFKRNGVRYESVSRPWQVGCAGGKVVEVKWENIISLPTEFYTTEQFEDIFTYIPETYKKSLSGILRDWYRAISVQEIPNMGALLEKLPVAKLVS